jgi:hypothetical protein
MCTEVFVSQVKLTLSYLSADVLLVAEHCDSFKSGSPAPKPLLYAILSWITRHAWKTMLEVLGEGSDLIYAI